MNFFPNLSFLRYFYSAAKHNSITKAAQENHVTQSAISQGIKKLEIALGKKLLSNRKNVFELTNDGLLFLSKCDGIFSVFADVEDLFNEKSNIYRGQLTFAASHSFALTLLPLFYQTLLLKYPEVKPVLHLGHAGIIREWISSSKVEFGIIVAKDQDALIFNVQPILKGKYGLYVSKKKNKKSESNIVLISPDSYEDAQILNSLKKHLKKNLKVIEILSWEVIAAMIEQGLGIGVLPDYVAQRYNLVSLSMPIPSLHYNLIAISSKNKGLTRNAQMFINLISSQGPQVT